MFDQGWYQGALRIRSPNFNKRPDQQNISLVVIHCISLPEGEYENANVEKLFTNSLDCSDHNSFESLNGVEVSAHFYIKRCGEIVQFVSVEDRAWHAGISEFEGRFGCNDFSIGIEMQGTDNSEYEAQQYTSLNKLLSELRSEYISLKDMAGHEQIAPGRKTDPGKYFDWDKVTF